MDVQQLMKEARDAKGDDSAIRDVIKKSLWTKRRNTLSTDILLQIIKECGDFDVNYVTNNRDPGYLYDAVNFQDIEIVKYFLNKGANVNYKVLNHNCILHCSLEKNFNEITKLLLNHGAKVLLDGKREYCCLEYICRRHPEMAMEYLDAHGKELSNKKLISCLKEAINVRDNEKSFILVKKIMELGVLFNEEDMAVSLYGYYKKRRFLFTNEKKDIYKYLIDRGFNVNEILEYHNVPLIMYAVYNCDYEFTKYLVEKGANVNFVKNYITPLIFACLKNNARIARLLVRYGADINHRDKFGRTPLIYACRSKSNRLVSFLLNRGALVIQSDNFGANALFYARDKKLKSILIKHGAKEKCFHEIINRVANYDDYFCTAYNRYIKWACIDYVEEHPDEKITSFRFLIKAMLKAEKDYYCRVHHTKRPSWEIACKLYELESVDAQTSVLEYYEALIEENDGHFNENR